MAKVAAIILNYNGFDDTMACLESVLKGECVPETIVVVDNMSPDGSGDRLKTAIANVDSTRVQDTQATDKNIPTIEFMQNNENTGYAGGNNHAMLRLLNQNPPEYFWIINNDVVVRDTSLLELISVADANENVGFIGSVSVYKSNPDRIQAWGGGKIFPLLGKSKLLYKNECLSSIVEKQSAHEVPDYIMGNSLLVKREVVFHAGVMDPTYFMYSEEADWQKRAERFGWQRAVSKKSVVEHGDSVSTSSDRSNYHYYRDRAAILYVKRFHGCIVAAIASLFLICYQVVTNWKNPKSVYRSIKGVTQSLLFMN